MVVTFRHLACAAKEAHLRASDHRLWTDGAADYAGEYQRAVIAAVEKRFLEKKDHSAIAGGTPQDASTKTDDILVEYQYCGIDDPYSFSIRDISESQFRVFNACDNEVNPVCTYGGDILWFGTSVQVNSRLVKALLSYACAS